MIAGVGIDTVSISRIAEKVSKVSFRDAVFTDQEIAYCEPATNKMQHYAARFAVKEAFLKATGKGLAYDIDRLKDIEVYHEQDGQPAIKLSGSFESMKSTEKWNGIHISITHEGDHATAIVILEK